MIVVDDAQWADEATLDVLRLLAGRLAGERIDIYPVADLANARLRQLAGMLQEVGTVGRQRFAVHRRH